MRSRSCSHEKGSPISGLGQAESMDDVVVFRAGTAAEGDTVLTAGGRVLGVTALGDDLDAARLRAYQAVEQIGWDGEHHRMDIALDAVRQGANR